MTAPRCPTCGAALREYASWSCIYGHHWHVRKSVDGTVVRLDNAEFTIFDIERMLER